MAHELTIVDGRASFAQLQGMPVAWHGFGQWLAENATIEDWLIAAGLDWDAVSLPVHYVIPGEDIARTSDAHRVIVRTDNGAVLGTASDGYVVHSVRDIFARFEDLCKSTDGGGWKITAAGALQGGKKIWAQAQRDERAEIVPGDPMERTLALVSSFDGTSKTEACTTDTRIVCANTVRAALGGKGSKASYGHRSALPEIHEIKRDLGYSDGFTKSIETYRAMVERAVSQGEARDLLRALFGQKPVTRTVQPAVPMQFKPAPIPGADSADLASLLAAPANLGGNQAPAPIVIPRAAVLDVKDEKDHRNIDRILSLFNGAGKGSNIEGVKNTRYGLLNAVTEFVDHQSGTSQENRLVSSWYGQGQALKQKAVDILAA